MARSLLALLMISWLFAGSDLLENPDRIEIHSSRAAGLPDHGQTASCSGDFVHCADHSRLHDFGFTEQSPAPLLLGCTTTWLKLEKVRNSAARSSVVGMRSQNFLNHSATEFSSQRSLANPCNAAFIAVQTPLCRAFYVAGRAKIQKDILLDQTRDRTR